MSFHHVADGIYARAGARTNQVEARAIVAEVVVRLRQMGAGGPEHSIGIVTFNAEQQSLIENLLDEARRNDPSLDRFFSDDLDEPVLVKNLEGVQGEERDVIIFSLTYGPDVTGRVAMNFGPLNQSGGERRLNVAVTRAREALLVFGSLRPEHIDLARTSATGVAHLKQFLTFAEHGARAFATTSTGPLGDFESPFEAAVAERLRGRGWTVHPQIGVSGFRVDLGIVDPDAPGAFLAGIECDGATYHRSASARDRDRLRQAVLEGLGWRIQRIWSTDWWTNAERETHRIHLALVEMLEARRSAARATAERMKSEAAAESHEPQEAEAKGAGDQEVAEPAKSRPESEADEPAREGTTEAIHAVPQGVLSQLDPAKFYENDYRMRLASLIEMILVAEGPVRDEVLAQRVARAHGFQRTGRRIREAVYAALPAGVRTTTEGEAVFLWPPNVKPEDWSTFRDPPPGQYRDPVEIPMEELRVLARRMVMQGGLDEEVVTAMRDAIGMRQMREASRQRCLAAVATVRQGMSD